MTEAITNQQKIADIRRRMHSGAITYDEAKAEAKPVIDAINAKAKQIAKKHNMRPKLVSFGEIMR